MIMEFVYIVDFENYTNIFQDGNTLCLNDNKICLVKLNIASHEM